MEEFQMQYMQLEASMNEVQDQNTKLKESEGNLLRKLQESSSEQTLEEKLLVPHNDKYNLP